MKKIIIILTAIFVVMSPINAYAQGDLIMKVSGEGTKEVVTIDSPLFEGAKEVITYEIISYNKNGTFSGKRVSNVSISKSNKDFLSQEGYISWDKDLLNLSKEITKEKKTDLEKVKAIFEYIDKFEYDYKKASKIEKKEIRNYSPNNLSTLKEGKGICFDKAALFSSMARSLGFKTKLVKGTANDVYHAWNEVLVNGKWVKVDATMHLFETGFENHFPKFYY